ncbi:MAG: SMI1/KNR4 family protein [Acaryochloris sp. CRU_2_0]|nr:SMI1/KNR4 family protein [Acaryochloris sp. CRU_2_0]
MNAEAKKLSKKLKKLLDIVENQRPGYLEAIGYGISTDAIYAEFSQRSIPNELIAIYSCIGNPPSLTSKVPFMWLDIVPLFEFIPFCKIKKEINEFDRKRLAHEAYDCDWIKPDMLPFLKNESGDFYCFRTLEKDRSIHHIYHDEEPYCVCPDLSSFFDMLYEMYKKMSSLLKMMDIYAVTGT